MKTIDWTGFGTPISAFGVRRETLECERDQCKEQQPERNIECANVAHPSGVRSQWNHDKYFRNKNSFHTKIRK
ncbi:hypothetical protein HHI36_017972 [Cryptolaemus montrouzieri]|uniref:Uncharacterized protein n=1 Tax=Cryptolaemus montrouzieri TaxID=559131 RepID=A0ABD2NYL5_9CUCU